jgi:aminoglycoside 6-adenylyltransferase
MVMLTWYIGVKTNYSRNPGKFGARFQDYLEPEMWEMLLGTYADADYDDTWEALIKMTEMFRMAALAVAAHFGFEYPKGDDERVTAHLHYVRNLPVDAVEMY